MGLGRIRDLVLTWRVRTKKMVEESLVQWWSKSAKQATELQLLRADAENRRKDDDDFYKLDVEKIVAIREELLDDFLSLAGEQLAAVRRLVDQLHERYEREQRWQEAAKSDQY